MFHALNILFVFLYHFFFIDQATGQQSNTKFFANVGYIIWCGLFPYAVIHGSQASFDLWLVFGAVVIGNRTLNVLLQNKAGVSADQAATWKAVPVTKAGVAAKANVAAADAAVVEVGAAKELKDAAKDMKKVADTPPKTITVPSPKPDDLQSE